MDNPYAARRPTGPAYDYCKYHGLGNDYLVLEPGAFREALTAAQAQAICDRRRGVGSDGILWGPLPPARHPAGTTERPPDPPPDLPAAILERQAGLRPDVPAAILERQAGLRPDVPALRIFNPDGSEAERSGNGLRIFARYVWEQGLVPASPFRLHTPGGVVGVTVLTPDGARVAVEMGPVSFRSERIPMTGPPREVLREPLRVGSETWTIGAANVGNPHCVVFCDDPTPELARRVGPALERHAAFPNRTNVQFARVLDEHAIRIEIWERGAGHTQSSGTSSCAAAAVACRLGFCRSPVAVRMPGGTLHVRVDDAFRVELEGDVSAVSAGRFADEFLAALGLTRR